MKKIHSLLAFSLPLGCEVMNGLDWLFPVIELSRFFYSRKCYNSESTNYTKWNSQILDTNINTQNDTLKS